MPFPLTAALLYVSHQSLFDARLHEGHDNYFVNSVHRNALKKNNWSWATPRQSKSKQMLLHAAFEQLQY